MSNDPIIISKFDLNSRERILNAENELRFQRLEIDKLTRLSGDFDKQIDHIKQAIKSFSNYSVRSSKAIAKLEKGIEELNKSHDETIKVLEEMEEIKKELEDYIKEAKAGAEVLKPIEEKSAKSFMTRLKELEKYKWMLWGGISVVVWLVGLAIKEMGFTAFIGLFGFG